MQKTSKILWFYIILHSTKNPFFFVGEGGGSNIPTLDKVLEVVNDDREIFLKNISRTTLYKILKDFGFSFEK